MKGRQKVLFLIWLLLAAACLFYAVIVRAVGSGTAFFIVWLGLGVIFLLFAAAVRMELWGMLPGIVRKLFLAAAGLVLAVFIVVEGFVLTGFGQQGEPDLDYLVVLGAQVYQNGPSRVLRYRLDTAAAYLEENPDTVCIVTGGQGYNEPFAESVGMAQYLEEKGIASERILLETESRTTSENLRNCRALMDEPASVGIVTNNFHMFRALQTAKKQGLTQVCGIAADTTKMYLPNNMVREFFGVMKFLLTE